MASKLKVDELRAELTKRVLDASGTKPKLVERLAAALLEESKAQSSKADDSVGNKRSSRKRRRDSQDDDDDLVTASTDGKIKDEEEDGAIVDIETLRGMGVRELREQASIRGVLAKGSKKELFERLCADLQKDSGSITQDKGEVSEVKEEKLVKATKKGAAIMDQHLPDQYKTNYHVLEHGGEIYDAMLNQTNLSDNNNKFYMIQALESDGGGGFMVFTRWGRVGVKGQNKLQGPFTSRDEAIHEFEERFYAKTKNLWSERQNFVCHPKLYTWLEMDYEETENKSVVPKVPKKPKDSSVQPRETKLESRIAKFISLICNVSMMQQQMIEIGYNAEKLPLGKLSKSTISKGYNVLKEISEAITAKHDRQTLEQLTGAFYSVIPHDFGFRKMREFIIDTPQLLKKKIEMVEALGEIELATKLLKDDDDMQEDPLYTHYNRLQCELKAIDADSKEYSVIEKYMKNTHAKTHSHYTVDIVQLFRVSRKCEDERFRKFSSTKNRMLLWHGSRLTNWTGILSQGLRIAPPEAPSTGYMFGKGVYFADMFSKSANYCYSSSGAGVLLLCEVALGEMAELLHSDYNADKLPAGKLSTKGVGSTAPDPSESQALDDGVVVPLGTPKEQRGRKGSLLYNEYIVYNVDQIRMRYLIYVNFNHGRR
ncbi:poly [ADP-ribose] polymerase 2-like [Papaver somniferum]|uniref:poly [ADP-ribose] polymerase 2-like n=1 Tax=Papaver somniferum TaxID=3469 RepID=UPI000E6FB682|nr:poly [ADP-ribose] polymerase 2-like [Papaver somniferum]